MAVVIDQYSKIIIQGFGNVGLNAAKSLFLAGSKIIGIAEKEGGIFNAEGINIIDLEKYIQDNKSILDFPNTKKIKPNN